MTKHRATACVLLASLVFVACGREGEPPRPSRTTEPPVSGDRVEFAYPSEPPTLDPLGPGGASAATRDILRPVLPSLFALDERLQPQPELVAEWPSPDDIDFDPFTVSLRLRSAKWSDGRPITSRDVAFSLGKLKQGPTGYRYRFLTQVKEIDARSFELHFDRPVRRWWALFSVDDMVLPAHAYSDKWAQGPTVAGGPFVFESWTEGLRVRLKRNGSYWGPKPAVAGIDVLFVADDETRFQLLDRDELDAAFFEGDANVGRRASARGHVRSTTALDGEDPGASGAWGPTWWELDLDPQELGEPLARAIVEAANPNLVAEILEDSGAPMDGIPDLFGHPSAPRAPVSPGPWDGRGDADEVQRLATGGKKSFQIVYPRTSTAGALAYFLHFRLKEAGVMAELVGIEPDVFEKSWVHERRAAAFVRLRRAADAPDVASYTSASRLPGAGSIDDLAAEAETKADPAALDTGRVVGAEPAAWARANEALQRSAVVAPLSRVRTWLVAVDGLAGPHAIGALNGPLWNAATWRFAS